jgi:hypothetical protein
MARLVYSVIASLDGYVADEKGNFDWAEPDEEVHTFGGFRVGLRADGVTATEDRRSGASGHLAYLGVQQLEWRGRLHMFRNGRGGLLGLVHDKAQSFAARCRGEKVRGNKAGGPFHTRNHDVFELLATSSIVLPSGSSTVVTTANIAVPPAWLQSDRAAMLAQARPWSCLPVTPLMHSSAARPNVTSNSCCLAACARPGGQRRTLALAPERVSERSLKLLIMHILTI